MNIFKIELKNGLKSFIFYSSIIVVFIIIGMYEFNSLGSSSADFMELFPREVMLVLGMNPDIDISNGIGYYSMLNYYLLITILFYCISNGGKVINQEIVDKTYEFIFTKPLKRYQILSKKLLVNAIYTLCINLVILLSALISLLIIDAFSYTLILYFIGNLLISYLFLSIPVLFNSILKDSNKGVQIGYLILMTSFIIGIFYDFKPNIWLLRLLTPLRYFTSTETIANEINIFYLIFTVITTISLLYFGIKKYQIKDLKA